MLITKTRHGKRVSSLVKPWQKFQVEIYAKENLKIFMTYDGHDELSLEISIFNNNNNNKIDKN